jgi:hypothetical protein
MTKPFTRCSYILVQREEHKVHLPQVLRMSFP